MDRLGFVPKASLDFQEWPFPIKKEVKVAAKKVAKKTVKKATTRKAK